MRAMVPALICVDVEAVTLINSRTSVQQCVGECRASIVLKRAEERIDRRVGTANPVAVEAAGEPIAAIGHAD
jgi:hypothetical protein